MTPSLGVCLQSHVESFPYGGNCWSFFVLALVLSAACTAHPDRPAQEHTGQPAHESDAATAHDASTRDAGDSAVMQPDAQMVMAGDPDAAIKDAEVDAQPGDAAQHDAAQHAPPPPCAHTRVSLRDGWMIQSSQSLSATGADISRAGFSTAGWHASVVPSTVLAALVRDGTYPDPRVRDNYVRVPEAPFTHSWWYRNELSLPRDFAGKHLELVLEGVSYRANVWLNGERIADSTQVVGTFVEHRLDVSARLLPDQTNVLAIEVLRADPQKNLAITFHDWSPDAADHNMGLWRDVALEQTDSVALRGVQVATDLSDDLARARLTITAELENTSDQPVQTTLTAELEGKVLTEQVTLQPHEQKNVQLTPDAHPELALSQPRVWWPATLGAQPLYDLCLTAGSGNVASDRSAVRFGVRKTSSSIDAKGHRLFYVNGKPLFVKGAGWASDMLLETRTPERLDSELGYVLDLGLNTLRLEGKMEDQAFYQRTDELGILTLPGWMCCDRWELWDKWKAEDHAVAHKSMDHEAKLLRNHPSVLGFFLASDFAPPDDVADDYQNVLHARGFDGSLLPSATDYETHDLKSGVKMTGPYDWVPPHYWYFYTNGAAFGFMTESSPGAAIPELDSLRKILTQTELDALWQRPQTEQLHSGGLGSDFATLDEFDEAMSSRHGAATSLADYVQKAQLLSYEGQRVPFEAYRSRKYVQATGFIHWLANGAWPSLIWNLYGYDLAQAAGYYATKKANAPLLLQYSYDDRSVRLLNDTNAQVAGLTASVHVYNLDGSVKFEHHETVSVGADGTTLVTTLPAPSGVSSTYFVALSLTRNGEYVSSNLYWLSTKPDVLDWAGTDWRRTPSSSYADYRGLSSLPRVGLKADAYSEVANGENITHVTLENTSKQLAFFVRLTLTRGHDGDAIWPLRWDDNYVSLEPGERREISVHCAASALGSEAPAVTVSGFNVDAQTIDG
jgi:exo-1,4-beta-D-glucosaminidase